MLGLRSIARYCFAGGACACAQAPRPPARALTAPARPAAPASDSASTPPQVSPPDTISSGVSPLSPSRGLTSGTAVQTPDVAAPSARQFPQLTHLPTTSFLQCPSPCLTYHFGSYPQLTALSNMLLLSSARIASLKLFGWSRGSPGSLAKPRATLKLPCDRG
ncbi:hypothetical protein GWK47_050205 [Chionoecetes opilio]|uniref:Uncharacterized protein n=1 Tax=Chionoecetes opilio TaxID=41210 RepID=A0A8J4Y2S8_CHIOP|nr:hypothetical protein GWK47_050205 [Chionoecetes opilio]